MMRMNMYYLHVAPILVLVFAGCHSTLPASSDSDLPTTPSALAVVSWVNEDQKTVYFLNGKEMGVNELDLSRF